MAEPSTTRSVLAASGELGRDLLAVDWDRTPLGPPEQWPGSLRTAVQILVTSKFSMWMAWGPELTFFCNDAYRRDTLGSKYPWALGRPASEVWSEIWPDIGPRIDRVMTEGVATWDEQLLLFLERSGFVEETYHTFSYSPLSDDDGRVAGMLCVVKEDTAQVVAAQRMAVLRDIRGRFTSDLGESGALSQFCADLAPHDDVVPFAVVHLVDGGRTRVACAVGVPDEHPLGVGLAVDASEPWPVGRVLAGETVVVDDLATRFEDLPTGAWEQPPATAVCVPLSTPAHEQPFGFLVVALNPHRPVDEGYVELVQLVAGQLTSIVTGARAYDAEKERAESLARLDRAKTDFFTNVSHEFRTPLTLLLGPAEDALADAAHPLEGAQRERMELVRRNGERLLKLVNSLLDFSRLESGRLESSFEPTDLAQYTRELAAMFQSASDRAGLALRVDCTPLSRPVLVDRDHWAKIVLNLLSNAVKFTFDGHVAVRVDEEDGWAVLTVSDTGTGIPRDELPQLFERFHRVRGTRSRTHEGSGIGLALVAELTEAHGGSVGVTSELGRGSTFTVRLPLDDSHVALADRRSTDPTDVAQRARGFVVEAMRWIDGRPAGEETQETVPDPLDEPRPRVLVVDDNADMREYVASLLTASYDVRTATDGVDALEQAMNERPDLVLTDVMMPRLDGFGLLERLQADPLTAGVPVIMLSARAGEEGTVEGLEAGASDYLVKPFSARELLARVRVNTELDRMRRVRSRLERNQSLLDQTQRLAHVGSWEIDLETETLTGSDELMRLLGRTRDEVVGRGLQETFDSLVHPDDRERVSAALTEVVEAGAVAAYDTRIVLDSGEERVLAVRAELVEDVDHHRLLRGSIQDVTEQRRAEQTLAHATARDEVASREHSIADELQRSLVPERDYDLEHLEVATFYRAGVEGTQVGGDWYDVIELGIGRTVFVIGDVMGRGVRAAAVMGQLRSATRAFARLDLPPTQVLEHLDSIVEDLAGDQIVTCVYGVLDSTNQTLRYANAGHLPPLLSHSGGGVERLTAGGPPLGAGYFDVAEGVVGLDPGSMVTLYTDGLVEHRGMDIDVGIKALSEAVAARVGQRLEHLPEDLVDALLPEGPDDDVAVLLVRVHDHPLDTVAIRLDAADDVAARARHLVAEHLERWEVPPAALRDLTLMTSELVTNAALHGGTPLELRVRRKLHEVVVEVHDGAPGRPRRQQARPDDEHGRGLHIVATLADAWGTRQVGTGKSVWCAKGW